MSELFFRFEFYLFVLAPIWSGLLYVLFDIYGQGWVKGYFKTFFGLIALQAAVADFVFIVVGFLVFDWFIALWSFFFMGLGQWWWVWSGIGFILGSFWAMTNNEMDEEYFEYVFNGILVAALVHLFILFMEWVVGIMVTRLITKV